jgi:hypothetical protein
MYKMKIALLAEHRNCFEQTPVMTFIVGVLPFVRKAFGSLADGSPL